MSTRAMVLCLAVLPLWATACRCAAPEPAPSVAPEPERTGPSCIRWDSPPQRLGTADGVSRHHPTVTLLEDHTVLVGWQRGKGKSSVAVRAFSETWSPLSEELVISGPDDQATHPQLFSHEGAQGLLWTHDRTGALRIQWLDARGKRLGKRLDLVADDDRRPGLYADVVATDAQHATATWYRGNAPSPGWSIGHIERSGRVRAMHVPTLKRTTLGGPPTIARGSAGELWIAWPEQHVVPPKRTTRIRLAKLGADGSVGEPIDVAQGPYRWERPSLAFADDGRMLLGWTGYPFAQASWSAWARRLAADGTPLGEPFQLDERLGRMVDVASVDAIAVTAWEEPRGGQRDLRLRVIPFDGNPDCVTLDVHPPDSAEQARASLALQQRPDGSRRGVVLWHASTKTPRVQQVWGRSFTLDGVP